LKSSGIFFIKSSTVLNTISSGVSPDPEASFGWIARI
jgi:hypothetical protein